MSVTAKITAKGQITIPRQIRKMLTTDTVEFEVEEGKIVLIPVRSVAGSLAKYAAGERPLSEIREKVWQEVGDAAKD